MPKINTKMIATVGLLLAVTIVLTQFSFHPWNMKIDLTILPIALAAILYGPLWAALVAALGDMVSALLFPVGPYFPGFTFTAFLMGLVLGFFLRREQSLPRVLSAVGINQFILGLFLNTYWISVLYGAPYWPLFVTRIVQSVLLTVIQTACICVVARVLPRFRGRNAA